MRPSVDEHEQEREGAAHVRADRPTIRASEIGDYGYCARRWWLKRTTHATARTVALQQRQHVHATAGQVVLSLMRTQRLAAILAWGMLGLGTMLLLMIVRGF